MNYAILLSGGTGTRIRSDIPKQYLRLGPHMMVTLSLKALLDCDDIDLVFVVCDRSWRDTIEYDAKAASLDIKRIEGFADPGMNRQGSILNGMKKIFDCCGDGTDADTVLVHDAARPFVSVSLLKACYSALPGHDGVMPVLPMKDTVYMSEDGVFVSSLLDRKTIFAGQAPELFLLKKYYDANIALSFDDIQKINGASEPAILSGMDIAMIPGDEANFKVTTDADLARL